MGCYPCHLSSRDQWGGPDWRLCPQAPPPKPPHSPRASGEMRRGAGLPVLPHFRHITRAWARGACSGKQKTEQVSWWWGMTRQDVNALLAVKQYLCELKNSNGTTVRTFSSNLLRGRCTLLSYLPFPSALTSLCAPGTRLTTYSIDLLANNNTNHSLTCLNIP